MSFKKIVKEENVSKDAHTLGNLLKNFNIDLKGYPPELLDIFPTYDKYDIIYDNYYVIESEGNTVHVLMDLLLDSRISRIYDNVGFISFKGILYWRK